MFFGSNIRGLRIMQGMTQDELASKVGVNRSAIQKYESGRVENVPVRTLEALAEALNVSPQDLMGWEDTTTNKRQKLVLAAIRQSFGVQYEELMSTYHNLDGTGQAIILRLALDMLPVYRDKTLDK